jgi:DNA-binding NarL/FixJ family response regulator
MAGTDAVGVRGAVIVDRHPLWVDAISRLLAKMDIDVRAQCADVVEGKRLVKEHAPDLVIAGLDRTESEDEVWDFLRACKEAHPAARVVVFGAPAEPRTISAAFAEGAAAYCTHTASGLDLEVAIRQSFESSIYLATGRVPSSGNGAAKTEEPEASARELTNRERQILQLVAEGRSNSQVARTLWITEQTVKFHLSNIYRKLEVANRTEASRWAQLHGLLPASLTEAAA